MNVTELLTDLQGRQDEATDRAHEVRGKMKRLTAALTETEARLADLATTRKVIAGPQGKLVWISRALPGRTHDLTAARSHRIVKTCVRLRVPVLADMAYTSAGGTFALPARRSPRQELTAGQRSVNRAHARLRYPVERGVATVKRWRIFHHARCSPTRLTSAAKAVLTLERQR
ncbi:transposase family protein [Kitasatospora sp. NPDC049258]|uniref:transposase family protein n=1 Tax=Kitasatospora sp. NPDC049258 TaxID=3155394 RepID=UPI0034305E70